MYEERRARAAEMIQAIERERTARSLRRSRLSTKPRKRDVLRFLFFPLSPPQDRESHRADRKQAEP